MNKDNYNPVLTGVRHKLTRKIETGFYFINVTGTSQTIEQIIGEQRPHASNICTIQVLESAEANPFDIVSYRQDGTPAVAKESFFAGVGQFIELECDQDIKRTQFISTSGNPTPVAIQWYRTTGNS